MATQLRYLKPYNIHVYDQAVLDLYLSCTAMRRMKPLDRAIYISGYFLDRPYVLGANGEGPDGQFDQAPLYRFDAFDCLTYVNSVLALCLSNDLFSFQNAIRRVSYWKGETRYSHRHHFISIDWNVCNQLLGFLEDVTDAIVDQSGVSMVQYTDTQVDCPRFFRTRTYRDIRLLDKRSSYEAEQLLDSMRAIGNQFRPQKSGLPYLPLSLLFDESGCLSPCLLDQMPQFSVVEIVRPCWQKESVGTPIDVSHIGFVLQKADRWYYRHASSIEQSVCDVLLEDYLKAARSHSTVKGINVQALSIVS